MKGLSMHQSAVGSGNIVSPVTTKRSFNFPIIKKTPNSLPVLKKYACVIEAFKEKGFAVEKGKKRLKKISLIEKHWKGYEVLICTATVYKALHYLIEKEFIKIVSSETLPNGFKSNLYELDEDKLDKVGYYVVSRGDWYKLLSAEKNRLSRLPLKPFEGKIREAQLDISKIEEKIAQEIKEIAAKKKRVRKLKLTLQQAKDSLQRFEEDILKFVSEMDRIKSID